MNMTSLDLGNANVFEESLTVDEIRNSEETEESSQAFWEKITGWLDEVQGTVFTGENKVAYLVIEITR